MSYEVYVIQNNINGKRYFGITRCSVKKRWSDHKAKMKTGNGYLYSSMRKYGIDNFSIKLVASFDNKEDMFNKEIELISKHKTNDRDFGYNHSLGGEAGSFGCIASKQTRLKMSKAKKGENHAMSKLTWKIINDIRNRCNNGEKQIDLAKEYNVTKTNIQDIVQNRTWLDSGYKKAKYVYILKDLKGNEVARYNTIIEASKDLSVSVGSIHNNLKGITKKTNKGIWEKRNINCEKK